MVHLDTKTYTYTTLVFLEFPLTNVTAIILNFLTLLTVVTLSRVMGAAALQKYTGSLGGVGASGVGSSSSYSTKEINKEVMPEKVVMSSRLVLCQ